MDDAITHFYTALLPDATIKESVLTATCPICQRKPDRSPGKIRIFLNRKSFFRGYFRCSENCVAGGFPTWFAQVNGIDPVSVPGFEEEDLLWHKMEYPQQNINSVIAGFQEKLLSDQLSYFAEAGIGEQLLQNQHIGFNGRYLVYPYQQINDNTYSARCVHPSKKDDNFWYGDESFKEGPTGLYNVKEIKHCAGGSLFLCEGEENLLTIQQLGFPGVAVSAKHLLDSLDVELFSNIKTLFIVMENNTESESGARTLASRIGFKVRILRWPADTARDYNLRQLAVDTGKDFAGHFGKMISTARPFSPFSTPEKEYAKFCDTIMNEGGEEYGALVSGFPLLDKRIDGIHGINIIGGGPKVGKSCFMIQIATEMAANHIPVLYYDFENGRQRIYQRTLSRIAHLETDKIRKGQLDSAEREQFEVAKEKLEKMLRYFRVVNDRKLTPEIMRRHIDFIRHETQCEYTVVVVDSLHKLPFKDLSERRSGIDAWLRQMESMRDDLQVSFLVISELSRDDGGAYSGEPHMGVFKGSGDIEYSADNAMVLFPDWDHMEKDMTQRCNKLWLVGSREHSPGLVGKYFLDYPYWGFREEPA